MKRCGLAALVGGVALVSLVGCGGGSKPDAGERADGGGLIPDGGRDVANPGSGGAGGVVGTGGASGSGGVVATGGASGTGGALDAGDASGAGGAPDAGDASGAGGASGTGGALDASDAARSDGAADAGADRGTAAATCAARASCRFEWADTCIGEQPWPCQCDSYCTTAGDCCPDVATACADARQDERDLLAAVRALDETTVRAIIARGRGDAGWVFQYGLTDPQLALLLRAGVSANTRFRFGGTPIMTSNIAVATAQILLDAGADIEMRERSCLTPLMVHIQNDVTADVELFLINHGANVNAVTPNGNTALLFAISSFFGGPVSQLLTAGADPNARNRDGEIPLTVAVRHSSLRVIKLLIAAGADVNDVGPIGEPLWVYTLVDNAPAASRLIPADDEVCEWVFSHPELVVDLGAIGAAAAIAQGLASPPVAFYAQYLQARGTNDPSLRAGELITTFEGSEVRLDGNSWRKNGLDLTPPSFVISNRPRMMLGSRYHFPIDRADVPPGIAEAGVDYSKRYIFFDLPTWSWNVATVYVNVRGASNLKLENNGSDVNVSIDVPGVGTQSRSSLGCFPYTRPYRP